MKYEASLAALRHAEKALTGDIEADQGPLRLPAMRLRLRLEILHLELQALVQASAAVKGQNPKATNEEVEAEIGRLTGNQLK